MKKVVVLATLMSALPAFAQDMASSVGNSAYYAIAASVAIGLAAFGGAWAQGKIGSSAMDGIARNPQAQSNMFVSMIIGLVLVESLVIYSLVIAFMLVGKIG